MRGCSGFNFLGGVQWVWGCLPVQCFSSCSSATKEHSYSWPLCKLHTLLLSTKWLLSGPFLRLFFIFSINNLLGLCFWMLNILGRTCLCFQHFQRETMKQGFVLWGWKQADCSGQSNGQIMLVFHLKSGAIITKTLHSKVLPTKPNTFCYWQTCKCTQSCWETPVLGVKSGCYTLC